MADTAPNWPGSQPGKTEASEEALLGFVKQSEGPAQVHQSLLGKLGSIQSELRGSFKGLAGDAVDRAFSDAIKSGDAVAQYQETIVQNIVNASSQFSNQDADALNAVLSRMNSGLGAMGAGGVDGATQTSDVSGQLTEKAYKVNTADW